MFKIHKQQLDRLKKKAAEKGKKGLLRSSRKLVFSNYKIIPGVGLVDKNVKNINLVKLLGYRLQKNLNFFIKKKRRKRKVVKAKTKYIPVRFRNYVKRDEYTGSFGECYVALRYSNFIYHDRNKNQRAK